MGHNWKTGEVITADLLNGVAQVADLGATGTPTGDALSAIATAKGWGSGGSSSGGGSPRASVTDAGPVRDLVRAGAITTTRPLVGSGDSHTDQTTAAQYLWQRLQQIRNQPGEGLEGVASGAIVPLGYNGMTLSVWLDSSSYLTALANDNPSVVVACWLTNDVRQGALGLNTAAIRSAGAALLQRYIDAVRGTMPGVQIVLRVPAPYLTVDDGTHYITDGTNVNPAGLAQTYTDGVRYAYYDAAASRPGVLIYDPQNRLFGITSPTAIGVNYGNQIHQSPAGYQLEGDDFAAWVDGSRSYKSALSIDAQASNAAAPWNAYYRDVEDPLRYALVGSYTLGTPNPTSYVDLAPIVGPPIPNNLVKGDLVEFLGGQITQAIPSGSTVTTSGANVRIIPSTAFSVTAAAGTKVRIYRRALGTDSAVNAVLLDTSWRYKRTGAVGAGGTTYLDIEAASYSSAIATNPANNWVAEMTAGDKVYVEGQGGSPLTIGTNANASVQAANVRLTGLSGTVDWSAYVGKQVVIVGTHA